MTFYAQANWKYSRLHIYWNCDAVCMCNTVYNYALNRVYGNRITSVTFSLLKLFGEIIFFFILYELFTRVTSFVLSHFFFNTTCLCPTITPILAFLCSYAHIQLALWRWYSQPSSVSNILAHLRIFSLHKMHLTHVYSTVRSFFG